MAMNSRLINIALSPLSFSPELCRENIVVNSSCFPIHDSLCSDNRAEQVSFLQFSEKTSFDSTKKFYELIVSIFASYLQKTCGFNISPHAVSILIGPWLIRLLKLFDKQLSITSQLHSFLLSHKSGSLYITQSLPKIGQFYTPDVLTTSHAFRLFDDPYWTHQFNIIILRYLLGSKLSLETIKSLEVKYPCSHKRSYLRSTVAKVLEKLSSVFLYSYSKPIITCSYLPILELLKLNLIYETLPSFFNFNGCNDKLTLRRNSSMRSDFYNYFVNESRNKCEHNILLAELLVECMPSCFLEGLSILRIDLKLRLKNLGVPSFIYDSNLFFASEAFKFYAGYCVDHGTKLIIGQHGNNYNTIKYPLGCTVEEYNSNYFIGWGDAKSLLQSHLNGFVTRSMPFRTRHINSCNSKILIVMSNQPSSDMSPNYFDTYAYNMDLLPSLLSDLPSTLNNDIIIRPYSAVITSHYFDNLTMGSLERLRRLCFTVNSRQSFRHQVKKSRLIVFLYDSTGFLQCLSSNVPCIMYSDSYDQLTESAKNDYDKLIKLGVIHLSVKSLFAFMSTIAEMPHQWWAELSENQHFVCFVNKYARCEPKPAKALSEMLDFCIRHTG